MIINAFEGFLGNTITEHRIFFFNWTIKNLNVHELIHSK